MLPNSGIPLGQWSGSDATDQLRKTIDAIAADTNRQNRTLLWMTGVILLLTATITFLTFVLVLRP
jgi:hypothetical protein